MSRPSFNDFIDGKESICLVGLGYVGLPLAVAFAKKFRVVGFDINEQRVAELRAGHDRTREISGPQLSAVGSRLSFATDPKVLGEARIIIVTVPTPIDEHKNPDLTPLVKSSTMIGRHIQRGTTVVYESTVYPGCTEEDCLPLIERESGLKWKKDFFAGYSPERINPGDKEHTVEKIKKVVSGDTAETADLLKQIYGAVITAGIFVAESIATAEAAKVIENTQRDLNIALMNELSLIFDRMGLNTLAVLEAAGTKWNFLPFRPGLVGGHCIGVDPYYLTFKAESLGYHPQVILAGRRINDQMGKVVAERTVKKLIEADRPVKGAKVLILGWTFKENVPDIRNSRVIDIYRELRAYGVEALALDPHADSVEVEREYGLWLIENVENHGPYDAVVTAVKHRELVADYSLQRIRRLGGTRAPVLIDVKGFFTKSALEAANFIYWQL
ncbi:MAG TPA: nucleotide sugar dehydrogenase [Opitutaceae bacterium]|nr:nucleotide sugar dehydrogenase [Opitutaceae bacterium]